MKKILTVLAAMAMLSGCEGKEQDELLEQLQVKFKQDSDLADYQITPDEMAECVSDKILAEIPGFPGTPKRKQYIRAYTKLVRVNPTEDFRPTLEETQEIFGSMAKAYEAAGSITTYNFSCIGDLINEHPLENGQQ